MAIQDILAQEYFDNTVKDYGIGLLLLLFGLLFQGWFSKKIIAGIHRMFRRWTYEIELEQYHGLLAGPLKFFLALVFLFLAFFHLEFPQAWGLAPVSEFGVRWILSHGYQLLLAIAITRVVLKVVEVAGLVLMAKAEKTTSKQDDQLIPFAVEVVKIVIIIMSGLIIVSNVFDLNIGSLVAGLGIGGLAIALAAKESLENLFGSFTIFFDKPFVVGDLVTVAGVTGVVEKVGFRSTRVRTLEKSYVTIPNKKMIDAELDNLSLRTFRRVKFNVGLTYGTKHEVMKTIVDKIQQLIDGHERTNDEGQVRFMDFGSSSLDIMVLYYVDTMDWGVYLEVKEEINYKIMEIVEKAGSDFAFPTQTVHVSKTE